MFHPDEVAAEKLVHVVEESGFDAELLSVSNDARDRKVSALSSVRVNAYRFVGWGPLDVCPGWVHSAIQMPQSVLRKLVLIPSTNMNILSVNT